MSLILAVQRGVSDLASANRFCMTTIQIVEVSLAAYVR